MIQHKMTLVCLFFLFLNPGLSAEESIDLTEQCILSECKPRIWYLKDDFQEAYLKPDFSPDSSWQAASLFPIWLNKYFKIKSHLHTFSLRTDFDLPSDLLKNDRELGIRMGEIGEVFSIYVNGHFLVSEGLIQNGEITHRRTVRGQVYHLPHKYLIERGNTLNLKISGDPSYDHTGLYLMRGYSVGNFDQLKYESQDRIALALMLVYVVIGLYHIFLYSKRRKENYNLYFGGFSFGIGIYAFTRSNEIFEFGWDSLITQKTELIVLYIMFSFFIQFFSYLYFGRISKFIRYLFYFHIVISVLTFFLPLSYCEKILRLWQGTSLVFVLPSVIYSLYQGVKEKVQYSKNLMFGTVIVMIAAIFDILDSLVFNAGISITKYAFFVYLFGIATVLADKFTEIHRHTEAMNANLEFKVKERTEELSISLASVRELKDQQDGDYFLTSLLLRPLGSNLYKSKNVKIEFWIRQKKKFHFKQWDSEIGGDICVTHTLMLKDREYTVFVNADAMGKSIQGAGGVLVLGSVFAAIIERTKLTPEAANLYPERWLKNSFLELQKVFETFDGSMLVSLVLGLVEDDSGTVYYINAEHPSLVLYREGIASFLDEEMQLRKLGVRTPDGHISVRLFRLKAGDILISGSDGRDDVMILNEADNQKYINEDETKFLQFVEEGKGGLPAIAELIQGYGDLMDDLSLLRIGFNPTIGDFEDRDFDLLWKEAMSMYRGRLYEKSFLVCEEIIKYFPKESRAIFLASRNKYHLADFDSAADMAERVKLRNPESVGVLVSLAFIHIKLKARKRAHFLIEEALKLSPNHKRIHQLLKVLNRK